MIIVSACLAGYPCRYDGQHNLDRQIEQMVATNRAIAVCPEELGGLSTPREPAEIVGGSSELVWTGEAIVQTKYGKDVSEAFLKGAQLTLEKAIENYVSVAILKERSPSCGSCQVYDGSFCGRKVHGEGITTALLRKHGIAVFSEETMRKILKNYTEQV